MLRRSSTSYVVPFEYRRAIIVSYRLPAIIDESLDPKNFAGVVNSGVSSAISCLKKQGRDFLWVGHTETKKTELRSSGSFLGHNYSDCIDHEKVQESSTNHSNNNNQVKTVHVPLPPDVEISHFRDFCKGVLWPLFHYYGNGAKNYTFEAWQGYCRANEAFANTIANLYEEGDLIFIQDYHLLVLPEFLRQKIPNAKIGLFLHTPWPSSEIYRSLPVRTDLLRAMAECDWIGFQTFGYSKHFLSACDRILGAPCNDRGIDWNGHNLIVDVMPVGIDPDQVLSTLKRDTVKDRIAELKQRYAGKKIIVARDGMEYINGIPHKLRAFQAFLKNYPEWREKVVLFQHCRPNTETLMLERQYKDLCEEVEKLVGSINGQFGNIEWMPVVYLNQQLTWEEAVAMFAVGDAGYVLPLRDGMNVTAFEFISCQQEKMSPLILSEFAGASTCLSGALRVNPWYEKKVAAAIETALTMTEDFKEMRYQHNFSYATNHTSLYWVTQCLKQLSATRPPRTDVPTPLPQAILRSAWGVSSKRVIFLDYDGTLVPIQKLPHMAVPPPSTLKLLKKLANDEKNFIYIISGRDRHFVEEWFGNMRLGLAAEHGNFIRRPASFDEQPVWEEKGRNADLSWRDAIKQIFNDFADTTPGSFVEEKEINLTWHYRGADPEFGSWQAHELVNLLHQLPKSRQFDVLVGSKNVEVRPQGTNKGTVVRELLAKEENVDFVLALGDDKTDEDMFQALNAYLDLPNLFSAAIGKKPTAAKYYVENQPQVVALLQMCADLSDDRR